MSDLARSTGLHELPPEIFESTLTHLDLESIKALRLVDRKLAEKCIGPRFLRCIQQPVLDVSPQSLRCLHALARIPALSKKIHSLTFLAITMEPSGLDKDIKSGWYRVEKLNKHGYVTSRSTAKFTPEELEKAKSDLRWLNEQQEARDQESPSEMIEILQLALKLFGTLDVIRFDGGVLRGRTERKAPNSQDWQPLWARASQILSWVLKAMVQSRVSVKSLDIFRDTDKCCIPIDKITDIALDLGPGQLEILGKDLISLKLSISMAMEDSLKDELEDEDEEDEEDEEEEEEKEEEGEDPQPVLEDGTPGIASLFLKSAPALRELDLTFRRTAYGQELFHYYDRIVDTVAHETQLPLLEKCALSGFAAKGQSLLLFLQKHSNLRSLTLHECHLTSGSWTPIFTHLERSMPMLENLSLKNLFGRHMQNLKYAQSRGHALLDPTREQEAKDDEQEGKGMVVLLPVWDTNWPPQWTRYSHSNGLAVHTRDFTREDLAKGLVFRPLRKAPGRALGSPELMRWSNSRIQLYARPTG
ncbi:uncharacterized protein BO72DRAFT_448778 [Aspergillus fijiensis CBS 313.89]|uniref:F-box domain-containing protein n=1 Tax=Aspergillus fijiensis CBS 313.89 TaxID=1448319 RepID=A0A8G1VXS7_9EURO|nr:uncharacterized protein BO72DRAFT_448778 [Aspergillus fijiensis CBS 313.89]RAK76517.1 hypothetical protein BO72DRAFT_448778 [Aspergillus fijiensis CBS 313.89]